MMVVPGVLRKVLIMEPKRRRKPPHYGVFTRIQPSRRGGVGVFAIRNIAKGTQIFSGDNDKIVWVNKRNFKRLPPEVRRLYDDFCIIKHSGRTYGCPTNFNRLTPSWYLNSSSKPNVGCDKHYRFFALRDIKAGEELTVDYNTYNEFDGTRGIAR
jgi:SET domain-containing protein